MIRPIAPDCARTKPLAIHGAQSFLCVTAISECYKTVPARATSLHVPHDAGFRHRTKGRKSLSEDFVIDFVAQITNEDVKVVGGVFFVGVVGLISPVDSNLLIDGSVYFSTLH